MGQKNVIDLRSATIQSVCQNPITIMYVATDWLLYFVTGTAKTTLMGTKSEENFSLILIATYIQPINKSLKGLGLSMVHYSIFYLALFWHICGWSGSLQVTVSCLDWQTADCKTPHKWLVLAIYHWFTVYGKKF